MCTEDKVLVHANIKTFLQPAMRTKSSSIYINSAVAIKNTLCLLQKHHTYISVKEN